MTTLSQDSVHCVEDLTFDDKDLLLQESKDGICYATKGNTSLSLSFRCLQEIDEQPVSKVTDTSPDKKARKPRFEDGKRKSCGSDFLCTPLNYRSKCTKQEERRRTVGHPPDTSSGLNPCHNFVQKTVLKSEKCRGCDKRLKFGCVEFRCSVCRMSVHEECCDKAPSACIGIQEVASSNIKSSRKGAKLEKREKPNICKQIFASPMLQK